jgi:hypothetical protein
MYIVGRKRRKIKEKVENEEKGRKN